MCIVLWYGLKGLHCVTRFEQLFDDLQYYKVIILAPSDGFKIRLLGYFSFKGTVP